VKQSCLVGVQLVTSIVKALEVCISDAGDVYVDYSMLGSPGAHISYHASGQRHSKKGRDYAFRFIGASGQPEPVKHIWPRPVSVKDRANVASMGWLVGALCELLPQADRMPEMLVDARTPDPSSNLAVLVDVVGPEALALWLGQEIAGFPILKSHRFSGTVTVEIVAFSVI
jgi:hypothetical protein